MPEETPTPQTEENQPGDEGQQKSHHFRQLEQSRDQWKDRASKWQQQALRRTVEKAGFDPDKGTGSLVLDAFARDHADLDPDGLDDAFQSYITERDIQPPSREGGAGQEGQTQAEQLLAQQQQSAQQLAGSTQPPQGEKPLPVQIMEAEQAGEHDKAHKLKIQMAVQQLAAAGQSGLGGMK